MIKTQEELAQLKNEYETLSNKLKELTEDELKEVTGGLASGPSSYAFTDPDRTNEHDNSGAEIVHRKCF